MIEIYNIEEEFLKNSNNLSVFPNSKDYTITYTQFKERFEKDIHREINSKLVELEKEGYFNDHGVNHIITVIRKASELIYVEGDKPLLSPYETFILLMAIQLHDTGHLISSRQEHAKMGKEILRKFDKSNVLSASERVHIGNIAKAHGGKDDPIGNLENICYLSNQKIRPQLLASILRLADELAEDSERASNFLIELNEGRQKGERPYLAPTSEIYHLYSASIDSCRIDGSEIILELYPVDYRLVKKYPMKTKNGSEEKYLLDEIYDRTFKTFTESLYCNRFLTEGKRISTVRVSVNIVTENENELIKKISYELRESGYPMMEVNDIFERCISLKEDNQNINGEFIKRLIESKNNQL